MGEPINPVRFTSAGERKRGIFHLQNVNGYHSRLKKFLARFNGVSTATLESYVRWFRCVDQQLTPRDLLSLSFANSPQ